MTQENRDTRGGTRVVATYADMDTVREAIRSLELGGVDGGNIALMGQAAQKAMTETDPHERDAGVVKEITKFSIVGGAIGFITGALIGLVAAGLIFGLDGQALATAAVGMAFAGLPIGGLVAPIAKIGGSASWEQTFQESDDTGHIQVGVHAPDPKDVERVRQILQTTDALNIERGEGRRRRGALTGGIQGS